MASAASQGDAGGEYWPIHIARSDGQGYTKLDHTALSPDNDADVAQLERWEVIVAGHLQNQVGPQGDTRQYKLAGFPRGYELRCALRKDGGRDYYLYGHPAGPKANYRTPGEFALHALWLVSDSADISQCPCDLCPKLLEKLRAAEEKYQGANAAFAQGTATAAQAPPAAPRPTPSQQGPQQRQQQQQQQQHQQHQQHQDQLPPPGTTSLTNVFRVGELVWYKHTAWRLGVILSIAAIPGTSPNQDTPDSGYHFTLAPLGHALLGQPNLVKDCQSMRPFLTFSVPGTSPDELRDKTFDTVDWQALIARYSQDPDPEKRAINRQVLGLEASKMGARAINDSFSTFDLRAQGLTPDGAFHVQHYGGVYLGAEMVRVGDPIRVTAQPTSGIPDPTVAGDIPRTPPSSCSQPLSANPRRHHRPPTNAVPADSLGPVFTEELKTRNAIERDPGARWTWVLAAARAVRGEPDVQGRFYVTERLMGVIEPARYAAWAQRGLLEEAPAYLNNRGHSGGGAFAGRRPGRRAMLGDAVAAAFIVPEGMVEN
ncbi:0b105275-aca8-4a02-af70-d2fa6273f459 [Thermothielavioides terrestris]|uniref:0b105275-aca8-4a02-af70-d2fa6273f459 n=1 Tax=Thermothielavioides terrestris TaxID=2587410 RepID=A0A446BCC4_9PEZI|nr:0b105275-aca8-4a02-af70-d2fa6273f459 [Thermothielavioides terrestris]